MDEHEHQPTIILVAGHWLGARAWDEVVSHLADQGRRAVALTLPGLDPDDQRRLTRTPADQAEAIVSAVRDANAGAGGPVVLVGHSGANAPVSLALDRHPELVRRVVWVDSGPVADGSVFDPDFPEELESLPLPDLEELGAVASLEGLDEAALEEFRAQALPEPGPVLRTPVHLTNEARRAVPTTLVCCSIHSDQVREMARTGHPMMAEVAHLDDVTLVDLPTGHWPMWSRPADLAEVIAGQGR